jgi:hypothetical protein
MLRLLWIAAALAIMAGQPCPAQLRPNPALRNALLLVQVDVNGGRLHAKARHQGRTSSSFSSTNRDRTERLTVRLTGSHPRIEYNLSTPSQRVTMTVDNGFDFYVRQEPLGGDSATLPLIFKQGLEGDLSFDWGQGPSHSKATASSLWHLYLFEPQVCRQHLLPLLEMLRPDWKLTETADQIFEALLVSEAHEEPLPWRRWHALVGELGDNEYAVRRAADRELRAAGLAVRSFLENYDRRQLDAEQRHRLQSIVRALASQSDNGSPEAIASWLATDPRVWLALLSDEDSQRRELAKQRLGRLLEAPIDFDPTGEPAVREGQIEALEKKLASGPVAVPSSPD